MIKRNEISKTAKEKETLGETKPKAMHLKMLYGLLEPDGTVTTGPGVSFQVLV